MLKRSTEGPLAGGIELLQGYGLTDIVLLASNVQAAQLFLNRLMTKVMRYCMQFAHSKCQGRLRADAKSERPLCFGR